MSYKHLIEAAQRVVSHYPMGDAFGFANQIDRLRIALENLPADDPKEIDNLKTGLQAANSTITGNREQIRRLLSQLAEVQDRVKELEEERDRLRERFREACKVITEQERARKGGGPQ